MLVKVDGILTVRWLVVVGVVKALNVFPTLYLTPVRRRRAVQQAEQQV